MPDAAIAALSSTDEKTTDNSSVFPNAVTVGLVKLGRDGTCHSLTTKIPAVLNELERKKR